MRKTYKIQVDCANCALNIENELRKMKEVENCSINFMTQKLTVDYVDEVNPEECVKKIKKVASAIDSDFEIL